MFANRSLLKNASKFFRILSWVYLGVVPIFLFMLLSIKDPEALGLMSSTQPGFIPDWNFWGIVISNQLLLFISYIGYFFLLQSVSIIIDFLLTFSEKMRIGEETDA